MYLFKQALVLCFIVVSISETAAQSRWEWSHPKPQGNPIHDVFVFNQRNAIIVGDYGTVIRTDNGGKSWERQISGTTKSLRSVHFRNQNNGVIVGTDGVALRTEDGGLSWETPTTNTSADLWSIFYVDENLALAVGESGTILRSTNGGATWEPRSFATNATLFAISFINSQKGFVVGTNNILLATSDGGLTWTLEQLSGIPLGFNSIHFSDELNGTIVGGRGQILRTFDGGANWIPQISNTTSRLYDVFFSNADKGIAVGLNDQLLVTEDGGENWLVKVLGDIGRLGSLSFSDAGNGIITGFQTSTILSTQGYGKEWSVISNSTTETSLTKVDMVSQNFVVAIGQSGTVLRTINGGDSWEKMIFPLVNSANRDITFFDESRGILLGGNGGTNTYFTIDGGNSWTRNTGGFIAARSAQIVNDSTIYLVGTSNTVVKSTNFGESWEWWRLIKDPPFDDFLAMDFLSENFGTIVGTGGEIWQTFDGGDNWIKRYSEASGILYGVSFASKEVGIIVGEAGIVLRTSDSGESWSLLNINTTNTLRHVQFVDETYGIISGGNGFLAVTEDGGLTWSREQSPTNYSLNAIDMLDRHTGFAVGNSGTILQTKSGAEAIVGDNIVSLETKKTSTTISNYPNPFNPSTMISFSLLKEGDVDLKVYSITGQLIQQLTKGTYSAGSYTVAWDGKNEYGVPVSSGVYIYRMMFNGNISSGKMLLVR